VRWSGASIAFAKQFARHAKGRANYRVNLTVRPVTALAEDAGTAAVRPAGYAGRSADTGETP